MEVSIFSSNTSIKAHPIASFNKHKPHQLCASTVLFRRQSFKHSHAINIRCSKGVNDGGGEKGLACGCAHWGLAPPPEADLETEMEAEMSPDREEWMTQLGTLREKCKERRGVVELLECLEKEAIMGEDEGREPLDYNRRALIFDTSSRVFQALKKRTATHQS